MRKLVRDIMISDIEPEDKMVMWMKLLTPDSKNGDTVATTFSLYIFYNGEWQSVIRDGSTELEIAELRSRLLEVIDSVEDNEISIEHLQTELTNEIYRAINQEENITNITNNISTKLDNEIIQRITDVNRINNQIQVFSGVAITNKSNIENLQTKVTSIESSIGTVPSGETIVGMIEDAKNEAISSATYDDTEVRQLITNNTQKIEGHKAAIDNVVTTLVGEDSNKSVRIIANEELTKQLIPETAQESLNTLQEIATWIQEHPNDASAMSQEINNLKLLVGDTSVSSQINNLNTTLSNTIAELENTTTASINNLTTEVNNNTTSITGILDAGTGIYKQSTTYTDTQVQGLEDKCILKGETNDLSQQVTYIGSLKEAGVPKSGIGLQDNFLALYSEDSTFTSPYKNRLYMEEGVMQLSQSKSDNTIKNNVSLYTSGVKIQSDEHYQEEVTNEEAGTTSLQDTTNNTMLLDMDNTTDTLTISNQNNISSKKSQITLKNTGDISIIGNTTFNDSDVSNIKDLMVSNSISTVSISTVRIESDGIQTSKSLISPYFASSKDNGNYAYRGISLPGNPNPDSGSIIFGGHNQSSVYPYQKVDIVPNSYYGIWSVRGLHENIFSRITVSIRNSLGATDWDSECLTIDISALTYSPSSLQTPRLFIQHNGGQGYAIGEVFVISTSVNNYYSISIVLKTRSDTGAHPGDFSIHSIGYGADNFTNFGTTPPPGAILTAIQTQPGRISTNYDIYSNGVKLS